MPGDTFLFNLLSSGSFSLLSWKKHKLAITTFQNFQRDILKERRELIKNQKIEAHDLLTNLLVAAETEGSNGAAQGHNGSEDGTRQLIQEMITGGTDTGANTLAYTLYLLAKNPKVEAKVLAEIRDVLGDRDVEYTDLDQLRYLDKTIKESMRLIAVVPLNVRKANLDDVIDGYTIPKGTNIFLDTDVTAESSTIWESSTEFMPERFENKNATNISETGYSPFGGGARSCPGQHIAEIEMKAGLVYLLRRFSFHLPENSTASWQWSVVRHPANMNLSLIVRPRRS